MDGLVAGTVGDLGQERTSTVKRQQLPIPGRSVSPQRNFMKTKTTSNESSDMNAEDCHVSYLWLPGAVFYLHEGPATLRERVLIPSSNC